MNNGRIRQGGAAAASGGRCSNRRKCELDALKITTPANCQKMSCLKTIAGYGSPDEEVTLRIDCEEEITVCTNGSGSFRTCCLEALCPGFHTIEACYPAAPECPCDCIWVYIDEPVILPAPTITYPVNGSTISEDTPIITGTAVPGNLVTISTQYCQHLCTFADANGLWAIQLLSPLTPGEHTITAMQQQSECSASELAYTTFTVVTI